MSQKTKPAIQTNHVASDAASEVGRMNYIIQSALANLRTTMPVKIISVTNSGGVSAIGYVDVQPMVSSLDGSGQIWPHGIIYNVPYMRIQGGSNGIILDPVIGDIGVASVCDRDISTVKNAKIVSAPGSNRKNDLSDIVYLMTIIGSAPTQYVQFSSAGITIHSPTKVIVSAPNVEINASTECKITAPTITLDGAVNQIGGDPSTFSGSMTVTGDVTAQGTSVHTHIHSGVTVGGGQTGGPV